jgi:hypothetical protein
MSMGDWGKEVSLLCLLDFIQEVLRRTAFGCGSGCGGSGGRYLIPVVIRSLSISLGIPREMKSWQSYVLVIVQQSIHVKTAKGTVCEVQLGRSQGVSLCISSIR